MRKITYYLAVLVAIFMIQGCDNKGKLTKNIVGTWTSAPEVINDVKDLQTTLINSYTFAADSQLTLTTAVNVETPITGDQILLAPISLSGAGTVTINGNWEAIDDDEINVKLDIANMQITVDPDGIVLSTNGLADEDVAQLATLQAQAAANIESQLRPLMTKYYSNIRTIDDIEFKNDNKVLKFEIGDKDITLTR